MTLELPEPVAAYFTADKGDSEGLSQCFTENAEVTDEGHTYKGRAAIKQWKADASTRFQYTCEPFDCERKDGKVVVSSRLTGNFPGSPVNLRFIFALEGDRVASLEIVPGTHAGTLTLGTQQLYRKRRTGRVAWHFENQRAARGLKRGRDGQQPKEITRQRELGAVRQRSEPAQWNACRDAEVARTGNPIAAKEDFRP